MRRYREETGEDVDGQRKQIVLAAGRDAAAPYETAAAALEADFSACALSRADDAAARADCLVVAPSSRDLDAAAAHAEKLLDARPELVVLIAVSREDLPRLRMPASGRADFIVFEPGADELELRLRRLLWPGVSSAASDHVSVDGMSINLATYQVKVDGEPVDFTYLEYALLAFLVTHPGHVFSRDVLLSRVWGFDYYGGSRTVDVHVRRVRAKLGTQLAARLETVRGVGYMWSM